MQAARLWKKLFSEKHLREHYNEKVKPKPSIGMDRVTPKKFEENLEENIEIIIRKVNNNSYHFTRYKQLLFTKGAAKPPRSICVPTLRDKLTISTLNELLYGVYGKDSRTQMPQIIIDDIIKKVNNYECFIKLDVKSFYASICQEQLMMKLKRKIRKREILNLIEKAIKTVSISYPVKDKIPITERERGIPEGLPISNALANIYMIDIDKKYTVKQNISYYRYVDDILILVNEKDFNRIKEEIEKDIRNLTLEFNDKKDEGLVEQGFEYLGYKINPWLVTVRRSGILKIEQSIEDLFREIRSNNIKYIQWKLNLKITGFILEKKKYGWLFFYSQITDLTLLFHLDDVVKKLIERHGLDGEIKIKRFVRTYAEMHKALHVTKYIPNLDNLTIDEKRNILSEIYSMDLSKKNNETIEIQFKRVMKKEIRDIEKDIQDIS